MTTKLFYLFILFTLFFSSQNVFAVFATSVSNDCGITATLRIGSKGAEVECLQGKVGAVTDGIFGPLTKVAVKTFQLSHKLAADGIIGPLSRTALNDIVASGSIYPVGCVGITGYSITTGIRCDNSASTSLSPTINNTPTPVVNNNTQTSPKSSIGGINNTKYANPNLINIDRFIKTVVDVNRKKGSSEKDLELMASALREQITSSKMNYNEEFKKMLIREASLGFNTKIKPFSTVFNKVVAKTFSFLGITPLVAQAETGIPFGGALLDSDFCVLSGNWMITITPLPPSFVVLLSYFPGTQGFASYNIPFNENLLGFYGPPGVCILSKKVAIPTEGTITPMVGSSPF